MLVLHEFPGDDNEVLKRIQFELYGEMVSLLYSSQRRRYLDAANLLEIDTKLSLRLRQTTSFDHRTLQSAHDYIAALFRFLNPQASQLQLGQSEVSLRYELEQSCREFFEQQLAILANEHEFTRAVCMAAAFGNQPLGVAAESTLRKIIMQHAEAHGLTLKNVS